MSEPVRLQRYIAAGGVAARRKAEGLITSGQVKVNGKVVTELGTKIQPDVDRVEVGGEAVVALDKFYVVLNKPKACITAVTDDRGRPTVMDYLPNLPIPVKPVGRLDFYTEGVLLLTNDGELAARLLAPGRHVPKTYHVKVHGELTKDAMDRLRDGVRLDDGTLTMPAEVAPLPGESKHTWIAITIHEGKHRQIHRMIEALGHTVDKLQRVAFGNLSYHNLRIGDARELSQHELNELRDLVGLDHSTTARGRWHTRREDTDIPRRARAKVRTEAEELAELAAAPPGIPPRHERSTSTRDSSDQRPFRDIPPRAAREAAPRGRDAGDRRGPPARDAGARRGPPRDERRPSRPFTDRRPAAASAPRDRDDRRGPPSRDRDDRRGPPKRDAGARSGPPRDRDDRKPSSSAAPRGGQGRTFGKRDQRERPSGAPSRDDRAPRSSSDRAPRGDRSAAPRSNPRSSAPRTGPRSAAPRASSSRGGRPPSRSTRQR